MNNPILKLIQERHEDAIIELISEDLSILDIKDDNGASMFMTLAYHGLSTTLKEAIALKSIFSFHESVVSGRIEDIEAHLKSNHADTFSDDGFTPIALAAYFNQPDIAKYLLYQGANPNISAVNPSKVNALHAAVARGNYDLVELFLNHNADVNATQMQAVTPLHSAAKRGSIDLVKLLLIYGAEIHAEMENGANALAVAKEEKHAELISFLESMAHSQPLKVIDKIALIELKDGSILSTRSKGKSAFYIPGGKRDVGETDAQTLIREIKEELTVDISEDSIEYFGTFKAQADGHNEGIIVKMTCYKAKYTGMMSASNEIEEVKWLSYKDYEKVSAVDKVIFNYLKHENLI